MAVLSRDDYARLKRIVDGALSLPAERRGSYLDEACGADDALRGEVESLLTATVQAAPLYETPALSIAGSLILDSLELDGAGDIPAAVTAGRLPSFLDDQFPGTDRYQVRRRIGGGGMGVVFEVHDRIRNQVVALKTLRRRDGRDIYQLKREFRNLADVAHPNLVSLYDLVVDDQRCFFTMELVDGRTLVDDVRLRTLSIAERTRMVLPQLIEGVQELHRRGLRHRDIKPSNVLVTSAGRVVILDFGLTSRLLQEDGGGPAGTPACLAPEQTAGAEATEASDWYSVGATLYHALTGGPPFDGSVQEVIARKATSDPPQVSAMAPDTPQDLGDVCMGLLRRDPADRISGQEALDRLFGAPASAASADSAETVFVGREAALGTLAVAFDAVAAGRTGSAVVYGPSGIGKSTLVQRFIDRHIGQRRALVFRGRCHEHESVPYKGLDGIVDGITRHLSALTHDELTAVLPADAAALARLFPVMRALRIVPDVRHDLADPVALRRKALDAFRELLTRLADRQPLMLDIDDFHWADAESVMWLTDFLRPPHVPSVLTLVSFRSEELDAKPFLRSLIERVDVAERVVLALAPMSDGEVREMVDALAPTDAASTGNRWRDIIRDSRGNPFLVEALARHLSERGDAVGTTLEDVVAGHVDRLSIQSQAFLEMLAVCGRPVRPDRIFEACGYRGDERPMLAQLRAAHLVRNSRTADRIEMYHDRIRETLAARIPAESVRRMHDLMAQVLIAHGDDDPESLFDHYRAAGHDVLAAEQAVAAGARASDVLAFDLAATFYRQALSLRPDAADRAQRSAALAQALGNAGRPVEAAEAFLAAAAEATTTDRIEWRRKAAEFLLIGGQIDRGLAVSQDVLDAVGLKLARGPRTAVASLVLRRLQLRLRGLEFTPKEESQIAPDDLLRIDTGWAISAGLAMVEPIRAAAFNVRQLLRALDVGDPHRIARAMALEAGFSVVGVGTGLGRSDAFSRRAKELAAGAGHQYFAALTALWEGIAAFLAGQWKKASELCGQSATTFREECTGVTWELNMAHNFFLGSLVAQGELREVARHLPGLISAAHHRGNFYLELELNTRMILVWLAADDADGADHRGNDGIARWSQRGFQRQHYNHLLMRVQSELYRGHARESWELIDSCQKPLRRSLFLRVQHTRIEAANYHARCALAMAAAGHNRSRMLEAAVRDARRLERENRPWSTAFARLLRGTVAHLQGDAQAAAEGVTDALNTFSAADMHLYAAVCRRRLGSLIGGDQGMALRREADHFMATQEIRNPAAMTALIAPGLPEDIN